MEPLLRRNDIRLQWNVTDVPRLNAFPPENSLHLLRIIQEAVTNIVRHANATEVEVSLSVDNRPRPALFMHIRDDGCGFSRHSDVAGRGIDNMKKRAATLGAEFTIEAAEKGTDVFVLVPIPR